MMCMTNIRPAEHQNISIVIMGMLTFSWKHCWVYTKPQRAAGSRLLQSFLFDLMWSLVVTQTQFALLPLIKAILILLSVIFSPVYASVGVSVQLNNEKNFVNLLSV